jgi:glycosyltransferase involved in cell wall biosynthesis
MKFLQICSKPPYPITDGHTIGMNYLTRILLDSGHQVKVLTAETQKHPMQKNIDKDYLDSTQIEAVFIDTKINPFDAFINLFGKESYNIARFYSKEFERKIIEILSGNTFDVVHIETLYFAQYIDIIRKHSNAKIVLREHNVEYLIWERRAAAEENPFKKRYLSLLAQRLKNYELSVLNNFDGITTVTEIDKQHLVDMDCKIKIEHIPVAYDLPETMEIKEIFPSLVYLGAMDWSPNLEGMIWFLDNVWEQLHEQYPELKFYIAGRKIDDYKQELQRAGIILCGEVESASEFICSKGLLVVPIQFGSGIRVKIIEGMSLGKAIVTSTIGAEGIGYQDGKDILIANTPEEYISSITKCLWDKKFYSALGTNAKHSAAKQFGYPAVAKKIEKFYTSL